MTGTAKMASLLRTLRTQTNGAAAESMESRGAVYPLNYGVSVPSIRAAAAQYAPDHALAMLLWRQEVRELRLAAVYIADPGQVGAEQMDFWAAGVASTEMAEHLALMLGRSPVAGEAMFTWLESPDPMLRYAALMCGVRAVNKGDASGWDMERLSGLMERAAECNVCFIGRGIVTLMIRLWKQYPGSRPQLEVLAEKLQGKHSDLWAEFVSLRDVW